MAGTEIRTATQLGFPQPQGALEQLTDFVNGIINAVIGVIQAVWSAIVNFVGSVVNFVVGVWNAFVGPVLGAAIEAVKSVATYIINYIFNLVTTIMNDPNLHNLPTFHEEADILSTGFVNGQSSFSTFSADTSISSVSIADDSQFQNLIHGISNAGGSFLSQFSFPGIIGDIVSLLGPDGAVNVIINFFENQLSSLINNYLYSSSSYQTISNIITNYQFPTNDYNTVNNYVNANSGQYNINVNNNISPESVAGSYASESSSSSSSPDLLNEILNAISDTTNDILNTFNGVMTTFWNDVMKPIWLIQAGALNTILQTYGSVLSANSLPLVNSGKLPYIVAILTATFLIDIFGKLSDSAMNSKSLNSDERMAVTFTADYCKFGYTTIYLSIVNDQILPTFGDYFGFLSIGAQYQQYWTILTMYQDLLANRKGSSDESGFQNAYAIVGVLKIIWTIGYVLDHTSNILNEVSSWPLSCQIGQGLYLTQIALRAVTQFIKIGSFFNSLIASKSKEILDFVTVFDVVLTGLQVTIFFIQS